MDSSLELRTVRMYGRNLYLQVVKQRKPCIGGVHVRGKWACAKCESLTQVPVDPHVIDKGIPTTGLRAQVLVAKYADHLPLTWSSLGKQDSAA